MSEQKQVEGLNALEDAKRIEATFKHKTEAIQQQLAELSIREHKLAKVSGDNNKLPYPCLVVHLSHIQGVLVLSQDGGSYLRNKVDTPRGHLKPQ